MDDIEYSVAGSPMLESGMQSPDAFADQSQEEKELSSLKSYLDSIPYECETMEEMDVVLKDIIANVYLCVKTGDWLSLCNNNLASWLTLRYPIQKPLRIKLAKLYYNLCLTPGVEPRIVQDWIRTYSQLIFVSNNTASKRKLKPADLTLEWRPLWRVLRKEIFPKKRMHDPTRNFVNVLLDLAEQSKRFYPVSEIPQMLDTFLPLLTKDTLLTMLPVIVSFLPPFAAQSYIPALFSIWGSLNSSVIDDRLLELVANLAEEHVAGEMNVDGGPGTGVQWQDVGIWTHEQWTFLMGKCLSSMNVPVGATKGASTTAAHADLSSHYSYAPVHKTVYRYNALAKLVVYSMAVDGPVSSTDATMKPRNENEASYVAGCKALDSLDKLITCTESFFHPSNGGPWTMSLCSFLQRLTSDFCKRWNEEREPRCKTPILLRLTTDIKRYFVKIMRTPALLAMFAKDPISMGLAQASLRSMATLEPDLIMRELLERAYNGLEIVNETHRTTAVLSMLSGVAMPLVNQKLYYPGQRHVVPLLELTLPGIDLNDPVKTVCATMFICSVIQHIKIGDLSMHTFGGALTGDDGPGEEVGMDVDSEEPIPHGSEVMDGAMPVLSRAEERALARDSTASFSDWVSSLFRRVFALYENLPEEGGKRNTTGGRQEESVLKSVKSTLDVVCLHLSQPLFEFVLDLVFRYATTNAKSNAVRAFGQLIACLARANPEKTISRFLPFCVQQIEEELKHGASSIRTTSTHEAIPSDTTLHWNLAILRGCLGYGGPSLLKHRDLIVDMMILLIDRTKSERGYSSTGRLISRIFNTLSSVYPLNSRFVNTEEWESEEFDRNHDLHWGRLCDAKDVKIEWHVPSDDEVTFILDLMEKVIDPTLDRLERLVESTDSWDAVARNDFCRWLHAVRSAWTGLPTIYLEGEKEVVNPCYTDVELPQLLPDRLDVKAGFTLTDSNDPRYQKITGYRLRYGRVLHKVAQALTQNRVQEEHADAIIAISKAIDVYLLEYGMTRGSFDALRKNYLVARELNRMWEGQKETSRLCLLKRAQVYHSSRIYMQSKYRKRSELDDGLIMDLVQLSLSPYTRVRRHSQAILQHVCSYFVRSTRLILPAIFAALAKGTDPDRMKGALYVMWQKGPAAHALSGRVYQKEYIMTLLECQHQEKPSIQKIVHNVHHDSLVNLMEEGIQTDPLRLPGTTLIAALDAVQDYFPMPLVSDNLLAEAMGKSSAFVARRSVEYHDTISSIVQIAKRPTTHWRYTRMAAEYLRYLLRRDEAPSVVLAEYLMESTISEHPAIRSCAQSGIIDLLAYVKIRTYAKSHDELWLEEWTNPLQREIKIDNPEEFFKSIQLTSMEEPTQVYVDKVQTGFLIWGRSIRGYATPDHIATVAWASESDAVLKAVDSTIGRDSYYATLATLWSQESDQRHGGSTDLGLRLENFTMIKTLAKMSGHNHLDATLAAIEPLWADADRYKQRAAAEIIAGLLRGSKHWPKLHREKLWAWFADRLDRIFTQMKPDTITFWETMFSLQLVERDPRRNAPLIKWLMSLSLDFQGDSAFTMSKSLGLFSIFIDAMGVRFDASTDKYINLFFDNADTGYAEIRSHIAQGLHAMMNCQWHPSYLSTEQFLTACREERDPLRIRSAAYASRVDSFVKQLQSTKQERLPPPRINQSEYDKVGLTILQWFWVIGHSTRAPAIFPYVLPLLPEFLAMSELSDNSELQAYSSAVLHLISAIAPPSEYIQLVADSLILSIRSSSSWRLKLKGLPVVIVFFYKNITSFPEESISKLMELVLMCLGDDNVEVREMAAKTLAGILRCSQRHRILPLRNRFVAAVRQLRLPSRQEASYAKDSRALHSAILGLCALVDSFPYSVESWMPPLTEVLAAHITDPIPISATIRKCASEFKKTHQDTWHTDQLAFNEDQLQALSNMLIGTSYYA